MRIVYACNTPLAGVSPRVARLINDHFKGEHEARLLINKIGPFGWYLQKRDGYALKQYSITKKSDVNKCLEWADVIHCNASVSARTMGRLDLLKKKVWVFQWHGAQIWPFERVWHREDYKHVKFAHIGQGWNRDKFFAEFDIRILPNLVSMTDEIHQPLKWEEREEKVAFSPSTRSKTVVNKKGVDEVELACKDVNLEVINNVTFEECLRLKRNSILGIDEVVTPYYHLSGLEFLSQGTACVCSHDSFTSKILKEATGSETVPFLNANTGNLKELVHGVLADQGLLRSVGEESRLWMEEYYHPKDILSRYLNYYRE